MNQQLLCQIVVTVKLFHSSLMQIKLKSIPYALYPHPGNSTELYQKAILYLSPNLFTLHQRVEVTEPEGLFDWLTVV